MAAQPVTDSPEGRPARDLVRHSLVYGSGYVAMAIVSFVLIPVYTRYMLPSEFGLLGLMLVLYGLMKQVYDLGFMNSVGRFFFDYGDDDAAGMARMRATGIAFLAAYGGVLTVLLWSTADVWSDLLTGTPDNAHLVRIVAVTLYAEALTIVPLTLIRMQERSGRFVAITILRFVSTLVVSIVLVALLDQGVEGALMAIAISNVAILVLLLPDYRRSLESRPSWSLLRQMLAFGLPFFPVLLSGWFMEASDRYLLEIFSTREEVGFYSLAYRIAAVMQIGVAAVSMGWAPLRYRIYRQPHAEDVYRRITTYYVIAASFVVVPLALFAQEIVGVVSPSSYAPAANVVPLLALSYALNGLYVMMVTGMGVTKKTRPMAWTAVAAALVNVGLNVLLIPVWGMEAAAATTVLANALLVAGGWFYSQRVYPIPYEWSRITRVVASGAAVVAAGLALAPSDTAGALVWALGASAFFVVALLLTRALELRDVRLAYGSATAWLGGRRPRPGRSR